jgi:hypothetical protein
MKKNAASQVIGAQMVNASTGAAFTGAVTVYVTGDGGTQAIGSVGSGACTHEGNGFHSYAPAQAETNYDHIAFTFIGTGAIPATVQVYTSFPQTGDNFARLGAPAGASLSADVAAVKTQTAAIEVDTADIQSRLPDALVSGRIDASVGAMAANVITAAATAADYIAEINAEVDTAIADAALATAANLATVAGYLDTEISAILADTNELQTDWANGGRLDVILDARASQSSVDDLPTNAELATALGTADDAVLAQVALVKAVTDKLDDTLEDDAGTYRFTANALEQSPAGGGLTAVAIADEVETRTIAAVTVVNGLAANVITAAATAADFTTEIQSGLATAAAVDDLPTNAELASALGTADDAVLAQLSIIAGYIDTEVAAIKAKTDNLPASPAATGDIPTAAAVADAVWDEATSGHVGAGSFGKAAGDTDLRGARTVVRGTVGAGGTTTTFTPSALSPAGVDADQFKGRIVVFDNDTATTALRGQASDITASSAAGLPLITVTALTVAPASGDTFSIV